MYMKNKFHGFSRNRYQITINKSNIKLNKAKKVSVEALSDTYGLATAKEPNEP